MKRDVHTCPDPETLAAFIDGKLTGREREEVVAHLADCADCYFVFSESVRAAAPADREAADNRSRFRVIQEWFARPRVMWSSVAGLAAAAALAVAVIGPWRASPTRDLQLLVAAVGTERTFEPRLTGGFAYGPVTVTRGPSAEPPPDVRIATAQIDKSAQAHRTPETLHVLGISYLVTGDVARAVSTLEEAANRPSPDAQVLSDLAAAYVVRATQANQPQDLAKALAAADRAAKANPKLAEALFNRAYAMERMGLNSEAQQAWQEYLKIDPNSAWASEARAHLRVLAGVTR
jgi:tetratricopeptide (TPR) repeat protein